MTTEWTESREELKKLFRTNVMKVVFTKSNGTERTMICTTDPNKIPPDQMPKGTSPVRPEGTSKSVFDLEKEQWRSFRWDSLKEATIDHTFVY